MVEEKQTISRGRKAVGFFLTLILLPMLFVGTCVPLGMGLMESEGSGAIIGFGIYGLAFLGIAARIAIKAKNPGIRWGVIVLVPIALAVLYNFISQPLRF